jgi:hypothetical protein
VVGVPARDERRDLFACEDARDIGDRALFFAEPELV